MSLSCLAFAQLWPRETQAASRKSRSFLLAPCKLAQLNLGCKEAARKLKAKLCPSDLYSALEARGNSKDGLEKHQSGRDLLNSEPAFASTPNTFFFLPFGSHINAHLFRHLNSDCRLPYGDLDVLSLGHVG